MFDLRDFFRNATLAQNKTCLYTGGGRTDLALKVRFNGIHHIMFNQLYDYTLFNLTL